jgi:hypothetical protein
MSPSINTFWDVNGDPLSQAKKQAAVLNCPHNTSRQIIDCLMQKGAQEIASTYGDILVNIFNNSYHLGQLNAELGIISSALSQIA